MSSSTIVRFVLCVAMVSQGYQLGATCGRALKTWVQNQEVASSTLRISRP